MLAENLPEALTFDDVLLVPSYSEVVPVTVSTQTQLTRDITLNTAAHLVGDGHGDRIADGHCHGTAGRYRIVHRNLTITDQAGEIDKVKRSESGMIVDPVTHWPGPDDWRCFDVMRRYKISGVTGDAGQTSGGDPDQPRSAVRDTDGYSHRRRDDEREPDQPSRSELRSKKPNGFCTSTVLRSCWW